MSTDLASLRAFVDEAAAFLPSKLEPADDPLGEAQARDRPLVDLASELAAARALLVRAETEAGGELAHAARRYAQSVLARATRAMSDA